MIWVGSLVLFTIPGPSPKQRYGKVVSIVEQGAIPTKKLGTNTRQYQIMFEWRADLPGRKEKSYCVEVANVDTSKRPQLWWINEGTITATKP